MSDENEDIKPVEENELPEEGIIEFNTTPEYIASACNALLAIDGLDTALMTRTDEKRIKRIRRQSIRIISECINELYDDIFDDNADDSADD